MGLLALLATSAGTPMSATLQVADRSGLATAPFTTSVRRSGTQRVEHHAMRPATNLRVEHSNLGSVSGGANAYTIAVAVELEDGTLIPATYSGAARATVNPRGHITTDPIAVALAAGQRFWLRTYTEVSSVGQQWPGTDTYATKAARGEGSNHYSVTYLGADWTVPGSPTWPAGLMTDGVPVFLPHAILGSTSPTGEPSWAFIGDSIVAASGDAAAGLGWPARLADAAGHAWTKLAQGGRSMADLVDTTRQQDWYAGVLKGCTHAVVAMGRNDLANVITDTTLRANAQAVWSDVRARGIGRIVAATITPYTDSTNSWATTGNQTLRYPIGDAARVSYNNWLRTMPAGIDALIDVAAAVETSANSGIWRAGYTSDGLHPNPTGHAAIASAVSLPA